MELDSETAAFFHGTWQVEQLLGFADSYNDASEYPTGQNVIGDCIIISEDTKERNSTKMQTENIKILSVTINWEGLL